MRSEKKIDIDKVLGKFFKQYRIKNGLTQEKIAEKLSISVKYISRIENGSGGVKVETLVNYMEILGILPNVLFEDLLVNKNLQLQLELSKKAYNLSEEKVEFLIKVAELLGKIN